MLIHLNFTGFSANSDSTVVKKGHSIGTTLHIDTKQQLLETFYNICCRTVRLEQLGQRKKGKVAASKKEEF